MTQAQALPTAEDYRRYDRVWQRVSPVYDPYPEARREMMNPPAGQDDTETLRAMLRRAIGDAQTYRCLCGRACTAEDRRALRAMAAETAEEARALQAAHFLEVGDTYRVTVVLPPEPKLPWRDTLRRRYHEEIGEARRCGDAAGETADPARRCLYRRLSDQACRRAERIRAMLERCL